MEKSIMKKLFCGLSLILITACSCHHKLMNHQHFQSIPTGADFKFVTNKFGPPYDFILLKDGIKEYRYIQRTEIAPGVMEYVNFIITVSYDGFIIGKTVDTATGTSELYIQ